MPFPHAGRTPERLTRPAWPHADFFWPAATAGPHAARVQSILAICRDLEQVSFSPGAPLLTRGTQSGNLFILISGTLEVAYEDTVIARITEPGSIVGELSVLLDVPHQADVRAATDAVCHVTHGGRAFFKERPDLALLVAELLARRLKGMLGYLADIKAQYADRDDHLGMVDEVLLNLAHRVPKHTPAA